MSEQTRRNLGRSSFADIEGSLWSITYPTLRPPFFYTIDYREIGIWLHLSKSDIDQSQQSLARLLKVFGTSLGAAGGAAGSIVPGAGTAAGALAGSTMGLALSELANIALEIGKYLATDDRGDFDIHMSPHGFQCGNNFAGDPNIFLGPLWRPVYNQIRKLQPRKAPGSFGASAAGPSIDPARVDRSKPMTGGRNPAAFAAGEAGGSTEGDAEGEAPPRASKGKAAGKQQAPASGSASTTPAGARLVSFTEPVTGRLALGQTHYWKIKPKGARLTFKLYSRLTADTHAVEGSIAVSDEEGGVIDRTSFSVSEQGEDFSVESLDIALGDEIATAILSIKSKGSLSDEADFEYKIRPA